MNKDGQCVLISGALGSGKTTAAAEIVIKHLALGGTAIVNMVLDVSFIAKCLAKKFHVVFDPTRLIQIDPESIKHFQDFAKRGSARLPVVMVLDEAALDLNARDWRGRDEMAFHFVILCRKLGVRLFFIAQDEEDMDSQIRRKFNYTLVCRSLSNLYEADDGRQYGLPIFVRIRISNKLGKVRGQGPQRLGWTISWSSFAFGAFDSHALHGTKAKVFGALEEAEDSPLQRIPFNPVPIMSLLAGFSLAYLIS